MRIPGADEALEHLARWAGRGRWKEESMRAIAAHFEPVCAKSGISEDELAEALGEFHYEMVEVCAFEDFCSRRPASRRSNVIDDYLDQRGWKESIQARDYLRALRGSVMSLYEVVEVKAGRGLVLRDLVRGGEPVEVDDQLGSQSAARWDRIAARVLSIGGRHYLSGAVLNFEQEPAEAVLRVFRISPERAKRSIAECLPALSEEEMRALDELLADRAIALEGGARGFHLDMACAHAAPTPGAPADADQLRRRGGRIHEGKARGCERAPGGGGAASRPGAGTRARSERRVLELASSGR